MFFTNVVVVVLSLIYICESGYVDSLKKCSIKDNDCMKGLYQKMLTDGGEHGIAELNIPSFDPFHFKDESVNFLDAVNLTVTEGVVKGMSKCLFKDFSIDIEKHKGSITASCDLVTTKAHFNVAGESPLIQSIVGSTNVNGNGKAKIKLEKVEAVVDYNIYPQEKDGEIYLYVSNKNVKYTYDVGNAHLVAEDIVIGGNDISQVVSSTFNSNFKEFSKMFGSSLFKKFLEIFMSFIQKVCAAVKAKQYIIEDLSPFVKH